MKLSSSTRIRWFLLGLLCGCALMLLLGFYIWQRPPLLRVPEWGASYAAAGASHTDGIVYRTFFPSPIYFVCLPQADESRRWFAFSPAYRSVGKPGHPYRTMFGYSTDRTPNIGVRLGDPKLHDEWQVEYSDTLPRFSSANLSVQITSRESN